MNIHSGKESHIIRGSTKQQLHLITTLICALLCGLCSSETGMVMYLWISRTEFLYLFIY